MNGSPCACRIPRQSSHKRRVADREAGEIMSIEMVAGCRLVTADAASCHSF